mmetsp:Transcript_14830/g.47275  ORF Transcript_14830/g.47275 Transcript_14830/m.47275 type:complete len:245 (+) Transcript_14830:355-1089(+)
MPPTPPDAPTAARAPCPRARAPPSRPATSCSGVQSVGSCAMSAAATGASLTTGATTAPRQLHRHCQTWSASPAARCPPEMGSSPVPAAPPPPPASTPSSPRAPPRAACASAREPPPGRRPPAPSAAPPHAGCPPAAPAAPPPVPPGPLPPAPARGYAPPAPPSQLPRSHAERPRSCALLPLRQHAPPPLELRVRSVHGAVVPLLQRHGPLSWSQDEQGRSGKWIAELASAQEAPDPQLRRPETR